MVVCIIGVALHSLSLYLSLSYVYIIDLSFNIHSSVIGAMYIPQVVTCLTECAMTHGYFSEIKVFHNIDNMRV